MLDRRQRLARARVAISLCWLSLSAVLLGFAASLVAPSMVAYAIVVGGLLGLALSGIAACTLLIASGGPPR